MFSFQPDIDLLIWINNHRTPLLDNIMVWASNKYFWIWLYFPITLLLFYKFRWKALWIIGFLLLAFIITDQVSVHLFKNYFQRLRPCHNTEVNSLLTLLEGSCRGLYGFVSSHAANTASIASFLIASGVLSWKKGRLFEKSLFFLLPFYVLINGYSRIYLGVHYPVDVICGFLLGCTIGTLAGILYHFFKRRSSPITRAHQ